MKFKQGKIKAGTYDWEDIIVTAKAPNKVIEVLIGGGLIMSGVIYLTNKAFRNGSTAFDDAQTRVLMKMGCMK